MHASRWGRLLVGLVGLVMLAGCQPPASESSSRRSPEGGPASEPVVSRLPRVDELGREPTMRVRVRQQAERVVIDSPRPIHVAPRMRDGRPDTAASHPFTPPLTIHHDGSRFHFRDGQGRTFAWRAGAFHLRTGDGSALRLDERRFPGTLVLVALADEAGRPAARFDVVNHVPMEAYLPGVLERELFGDWELEAFVAQAIVARSYALFERRVNAERHYDIQSTTASQVYAGAATNPRAIDAARMTRGLAMTYHGEVVPGFYSSTCGGLTQTAASAFPHFEQAVGIAPLRGGVTCDDCRASPHRRWGPLQRDARVVAERIAAWGRANKHPVAALQGLRDVRMSHRSVAGRPARFELIDRRGRRYAIAAEHFRFGCNFDHPAHGPVPREQQLRSSHVHVSLAGGRLRFTDGRGFGHGAGMCQWGAQGMAQRGRTGRQIVRRYYPEAELQSMY